MDQSPLSQQPSPLTPGQLDELTQLTNGLSHHQRTWASGFLAGLAREEQTPSLDAVSKGHPSTRLTILFGSETGNAESMAERVRTYATARGLQVRICDMADYRTTDLASETLLLIITSTHGAGEPPDSAREFCEFLFGQKAPRLSLTRFAVLGLGDSSYEHFCKIAKDVDGRLEDLGATRIHPRIDCDANYEDAAERWTEAALEAFAKHTTGSHSNVVTFSTATAPRKTTYDRRSPFPAQVLENLVLNGRGSDKETRHIELSLRGSDLHFEPGDVLCVMPQNRPKLVSELLDALNFSGNEAVTSPVGEVSLARALTQHYEIGSLAPPLLKVWADVCGAGALQALTLEARRRDLLSYIFGRDLLDLVRAYPVAGLPAQDLIDMLPNLRPREYSIASSENAHADEVHLTVATVRYRSHRRARYGVASTWLAGTIKEGDTVPVYIKTNKNFRLPSDPDTPAIMIAAGTGIAPFRAFVEERAYRNAQGHNWLFFGDRHLRTDFLYQREWLRYRKAGLLNRLDVAFSRDTDEKCYVQHRLRSNARELYAWLQAGAHIYICGDAERLASDAHRTLVSVVMTEGGVNEAQATDYLRTLQRSRRYQRDVY